MSNKVNTPTKVPCGGFVLGEGLALGEDGKTLNVTGGGSQADWNQNDTTAADYIKNRPFYTGDPVKTEIIPATTVAFSEMDGLMSAMWPESFDLVDGKTYFVSWDGTDYVCTGILFNGAAPILGNLGILGAGPDTGEPFIFMNQGQWLVASTESATEHIIGISEFAVEVVKIPDKYVSDTFRDIVTAGNPLRWSKDDWAAYYGLFQNRKLLKINVVKGSNYEGYVLSMYHDARTRVTQITTITALGGLYYLSTNSDTNERYWAPVFDNDQLYLRYIQTGSDTNPTNREEYDRLDLSNGLSLTTKNANEDAFSRKVVLEGDKNIVLSSSTANSTKKFKITVDDSGTISATEVTT